jgi:hypothetical protein
MPHEPAGPREAAPRNLAAFNTGFEDTDRGGSLEPPEQALSAARVTLFLHSLACETLRHEAHTDTAVRQVQR